MVQLTPVSGAQSAASSLADGGRPPGRPSCGRQCTVSAVQAALRTLPY
jgi:hypothetical protein